MGWQVRVGEGDDAHTYHLLNMSIEEIDALANEVGLHWSDLWPEPFSKKPLVNAAKVVRHLAARHGIEVPDPLTPRELFGYWDRVDDGLPSYWDGILPKGEEPPTSTGSSSGAPSDSSGPPTSSEDSPSET